MVEFETGSVGSAADAKWRPALRGALMEAPLAAKAVFRWHIHWLLASMAVICHRLHKALHILMDSNRIDNLT